MRVEPCTPEYLAALQMPAAMDVDTRSNVLGDPKAEAWLKDYAWVLLAPDPVAVVGIFPRWARVGYAFAMLSDVAVKSYGLSVTRTTLHALRYAETQLGMRRIEAAVKQGDQRCEQWIRRLGFSFEGVMHRFGPGAVGDYGLWARLS
jgi:hypothetical protein